MTAWRPLPAIHASKAPTTEFFLLDKSSACINDDSNVRSAIASLLAAAIITACGQKPPVVNRANPASTNCMQQGGKHVVERGPGGEFGICQFSDNRQCEEWALLRGQCPQGGIRIAGYVTAGARYCAITG